MIRKIINKIKCNITFKLISVMFISGLMVITLFLCLQSFFINPMAERIFIIEVDRQLEQIVYNIENSSISNDDILSIALLFDGGVTIVDKNKDTISLSRENNATSEKDNLYKTILANKIKEDLKQGEPVNEILEFEDEKVMFIGKSFKINNEYYYLYTYKRIQDIGFTKMFAAQSLGFMSFLIPVIYMTQVVINRALVKPIKKINEGVYSIANGKYEKIEINSNDELGSLSNSLNILSDELQQVESLRRELISNISHELRSPLVLIRGYAELVRDVSWSNDVKREEQLNLIINESVRMTNMVNDILDYSQLQTGAISVNKEKYNVIKVIEGEFFIAKKECELCNIEIEFIRNGLETKYAYVDILKLSQVFRNLFSNAINHTTDYGIIQLVLKEIDDDTIRVSVINEGETIPKEMLKNLFEKYYRVQHQAGRKKGTGIGLSIVKAVCELHDYEYGVTSENGITNFYVDIKCMGDEYEETI